MKITSKVIVSAIVIVFAISGCGVSYGIVSHKDADHGFNEINAENPDANEVFPRGKGYTLTDKQASQYQLPEKSSQDINLNDKMKLSQDGHQDPFNSQSRNGNRKIKLPSNPGGKTSDVVLIIPDTIKLKQELTAGDKFTFSLTIKTMKGAVDSKDIKVLYDDIPVAETSSKDGKHTYTIKVAEGEKKVVVEISKSSKHQARKGEYTIIGKPGDEPVEPIVVSMTSDVNTDIEGITFDLSESFECKDASPTYKTLIKGVLEANDYSAVIKSDGIRSISGFDSNQECSLSSSAIQRIIEKIGNPDLTENMFTTTNTQKSGTIANGDFYKDLKWYVVDSSKPNTPIKLNNTVDKKKLPNLKLVYGYM